MKSQTPERGSALLLCAAAGLVMLLPWLEAGGRENTGVWLDMAAHILALMVMGMAAWQGAIFDRPLGRAWLPAMGVLLVSAAAAPYGFAATLRLFEMSAALTLALALAAALPAGAGVNRRRLLAQTLVLAAVMAALAAMALSLSGGGRGAAGFVNPNHLAAFLIAVLPLTLALKRSSPWPGRLAALLLGGGLLASGSRAALLAVVVAALAMLPWLARRHLDRKSMRQALMAIGFFAILATVALWGRFADGGDIYRYDRLRIWPQVVAMTLDAPLLGVGPGQFPYQAGPYNFPRDEEVVRYGRAFQTPHSYPLLLLSETGILGTLALSLGLALTIRVARRRWQERSDGDLGLATAAAVGLFLLGFVSLVDEPLARPPLLLTAAVLAGLALPPLPARRPATGMGRTLTAMALSIVLVALVIQPSRAQALALEAAATADPAARAGLLAAARRALPGQVHYALAEAQLLLDHAVQPLDLRSYARIRVAADNAVSLDPTRSAGHLLRARLERRACIELLRTESACARAAADYQLAGSGAPKDARLLREKASFAVLRGELDEAAADLQRAVALEPAYVRAWGDLLAVQLQRSVPPERLAQLEAELQQARQVAATIIPDSGYAQDILQSDVVPSATLARDGGV